MKLIFFVLLFFLVIFSTNAQKPYFQQEVNYNIEVELIDSTHMLTGNIAFEYINNSPDTLTYIYLHLWPNAFKNKETAYANQELSSGSRDFYFALPEDLGYIKNLDFKADGEAVRLETDKQNPDIAKLQLIRPIYPGSKTVFTSPFTVKIPASFSRLGHVGQSYQVTQWYPKPAVYDNKGWHAMPYLDQGEFFSEFGSFDVRITLPENYIVGATGTLESTSEKRFLEKRIEETNVLLKDVEKLRGDTIPPSSPVKKTIRFTAKKVHDFAWFADKRFYVRKGEVLLKSGRKVDTWVMFTNVNADLWANAIDYVNRSVSFYSERVGEYPYPQATAIQSALSAGGGMEYPMITVIGKVSEAYDLDIVITHEVGHNWFYGILASNERAFAWMDEGLNSFYEQAYSSTYYPGQNANPLPGFMTKKIKHITLNELLYKFQASRNLHQVCNTPSDELSPINYGLCAYLQPAWNLQYLEHYLGTDLFDKAMKAYYETWKFRHPYPEDLRNTLENVTGKNLSWLFDDLFGSIKKPDFAVTGISKEKSSDLYAFTIRNTGGVNVPLSVSFWKKDSLENTTWIEPFSGKIVLKHPLSDAIILDPLFKGVTIRRDNDQMRVKGMFRKVEPLIIRFLPGIDRPDRTNLYILPAIAYNQNDQLMAGVVLYNGLFPSKKMDFYLAPLYSFTTNSIAGIAEIRRHFYSESKLLHRLTLALEAKSFHFDQYAAAKESLRYLRLVPSIQWIFNKPTRSKTEHSFMYRFLWLKEQYPAFNDGGEYEGIKGETSKIHEWSYQLDNTNALSPYRLKVSLEHQRYEQLNGDPGKYLRLTASWSNSIYYAPDKAFSIRFFGGYFIQNTGRDAGNILASYRSRGSLGLSSQGFNDYKYDEFHFGRNSASGIGSRQVSMTEGGMKFNFGAPFANTAGFSNDFIFAMNLKASLPKDLPLKLPLKPYFDAGYFHNAQPTGADDSFEDQFFWSAGIMLDLGNVFGLYFPVVQSKNLENLYAEKAAGNYLKRITFSFNINGLRPADLLSKLLK